MCVQVSSLPPQGTMRCCLHFGATYWLLAAAERLLRILHSPPRGHRSHACCLTRMILASFAGPHAFIDLVQDCANKSLFQMSFTVQACKTHAGPSGYHSTYKKPRRCLTLNYRAP